MDAEATTARSADLSENAAQLASADTFDAIHAAIQRREEMLGSVTEDMDAAARSHQAGEKAMKNLEALRERLRSQIEYAKKLRDGLQRQSAAQVPSVDARG